MRARALLVVLGVVALAALALGRAPSNRRAPGSRTEAVDAARTPAREPPPSAVEPGAIRDVFRFADDPVTVAAPAARPGAAEGEVSAPVVLPPGPRLVGLLRRSGRLVAALAAADGEVDIAGPGETAAGVTVVSVGEDQVRIRRTDGSEETLVLP